MSAHEGVSCDACGKSNFRSKRYKCLICHDYDLCSTCYEQGEASNHHTNEHPMQCILTRQDFDFYYHGERYTSDQAQSFTCPFCGEMGFSLPFINESSSSQNLDLFHHLQLKHADEQQTNEVICPICAAMINGEPNLVTADLLSHIANDHQHQQVQTPSTSGIGTNPYSRQSSSNREPDFSNARAGFRRGPLRTPGRRGALGRGSGTVSQHFVVDTSTVNGGSDPIADLLTQLSTVRRLAAANSTNNSSSSNTINLQTLTRQQYERERLRTAGRSHHQQQQSHHSQSTAAASSPSSNSLSSIENDFFDSLFASALFIDSSSSTNNNHQTWAQIVAQQQSTPEQQQQQQSSTTKTPASEPDSSLLRRLCDENSSSLTQQTNNAAQQQKRKSDFLHSLLFSSFVCPLNDTDK
ncbi:unnamed protein product [Rotaria magnacalcarata]|uniref:RING-type E3 ubiquitin transferase n=1 Tax=Rotaria magnacalcarata TaxID=392030 RepID=A0A819PY75_9BILA|nr:unnamed protein product [Rotaria magnacalcarata]CAF2082367.1 unnamed protein product [Rotaria magnacalcarata]CAF2153337.1 unnamed protein product [Rotaria magnacalcarata]CAF2252761.1 unnamed protein product [Rotaria magnacalcarata]CAF3813366.1 unnamed protein product [Rotaria magnacalcarata]